MNNKDNEAILLSVKSLKTQFITSSGVVKAVDGVSFTLAKRQVLGIVGESGSGKSVTGYSLLGLLPPNGHVVSGEIVYNGVDLSMLKNVALEKYRGKEMSMIFQDPMTSLDPTFKISSQMIEVLKKHGIETNRKKALALSVEMLKAVGIKDPNKIINNYPFELSGGMCQRVIIAMALSMNPSIIIADEPTTALDVTVQSQVLSLIREIKDKKEAGVILITHNLGVIWEMADYVLVFYAGNVVEEAAVKVLYKNPLHPYTWGLFKSIPKLTGKSKEPFTTIKGLPPDLRLTGEGCNFSERCQYAREKCTQQKPSLVAVDKYHKVACHFPGIFSEEKAGEKYEG